MRLFCQDECRIGLMPITRHRITLPGVKPIQESKPGYEYFYLYGAVEPETGQRFFTEHERLNSNCFQVFLNRFTEAFPQSHRRRSFWTMVSFTKRRSSRFRKTSS